MTDRTLDVDATVSVVDDDAELAETYAIWLRNAGLDVRQSHTGESALDRIDDTVDVVLLDRRMPGEPGGEVLDRIRDRPGTYRVAMLTAVEPSEDILDLPFDDYLTKPVDCTAILDTVEGLLLQEDLESDLRELFQLTAKHSTLELRSGTVGQDEDVLAELESEIRARKRAAHAKLRRLEDPNGAWSVVEPAD